MSTNLHRRGQEWQVRSYARQGSFILSPQVPAQGQAADCLQAAGSARRTDLFRNGKAPIDGDERRHCRREGIVHHGRLGAVSKQTYHGGCLLSRLETLWTATALRVCCVLLFCVCARRWPVGLD